MVRKSGCKNGLKVGRLCLRRGDDITVTKSIKNVTKLRWGANPMKWDLLPADYYHVNRIHANKVQLAVADKDTPFVSVKHIYEVSPKKLKGKIKKR